ncbi:MAG: sulfatase-like hydrolase/transferase [Chloroflexota bacterium]
MNHSQERPNILLIMADNHPANLLGCYGNTEIHTPHIDRLSRQGTQFKQAYCVNAMCSPCRASVLTGLMPSQHGIHTWIDDRNMDTWPAHWNALAEFDTLPEILKSHGYQTALIGKYHLGDPSASQNGFDHWVTFPHGHTRNFWGNSVIDNGDVYTYDGHIVDFFTNKAVDYLQTCGAKTSSSHVTLSSGPPTDKPFFLCLTYNGPYGHWPAIQGTTRNRFAKQYANCPMRSVPREGLSWPAIEKYLLRQHKSGGGLDYSAPLRIPNDMTSLRNYFSQMSMVDDGVGQILATLDEQDLAADTLVIYTCDHGFSLGHHGFWGHGQATWPANTHAAAFHIPLIVRQPDHLQAQAPSTIDTLVSQIDLYPTLLDVAGVGAESYTTKSVARSLASLLTLVNGAAEEVDWEELIWMEQEETRALRTDRWLFMQRFSNCPAYPLKNTLYDLRDDPDERNDVAGTLDYAEVEATLTRQANEFFDQIAAPQYNLWRGGTAKSNSDKPWFWRTVWGETWSPVLE